jgi:diguanylate cyclase (GGDEF)-like protein
MTAVPLHCLDSRGLEQFLARRRFNPNLTLEMSLAENLVAILRKANEFVPSSAGSILLDHPSEKTLGRRAAELTFIAAFGDASAHLVGQRIIANRGIVGHVYQSGAAYLAPDARADEHFWPGMDKATKYTTESLLAVPIRIGSDICGVLELINRLDGAPFSERDRGLMAIFADYISISIQNVLDGRQAHEIAKRDNLTGLYNDRYLHIALDRAIADCRSAGQDLSVLFLDLDYFKRVNDTHGHLAGSQVLREMGTLLSAFAKDRQPDWITARYGGDEFVIAMPALGLSPAVGFAEDIRNAIVQASFCDQPSEIQLEPLHLTGLTCSVGVASLRRHVLADTPPEQCKSTLLRLADSAMYVAKETGRNQTAMAGKPIRRTGVMPVTR